jgi:hypothetical protein
MTPAVINLAGCPETDSQPRNLDYFEFRKRWSGRIVHLGKPEIPDSAWLVQQWACITDFIWPVVGPDQFVCELWAVFPGQKPTMWVCRHEVVGD